MVCSYWPRPINRDRHQNVAIGICTNFVGPGLCLWQCERTIQLGNSGNFRVPTDQGKFQKLFAVGENGVFSQNQGKQFQIRDFPTVGG